MKILQIVQFFSAKHGGSAMVPYEMSKHLHNAGHDVTVLTTDFQMDNDFIDFLDGVEVIPFHCQMNIGSLLISSSMKKYLKQNINKFDIIHMHNFRTYQNIIVHKFAKKHKIPYVIQAHGSVLPFFQKQILKNIFDLFFGNKILRDASKVIALTKTEAKQYTKMGVDENKIEIVPNGINLSEYEKLPDKGVFRKKYGINSNEKTVLYLGRIHRIKGIDLLVNTFSDLAEKMEGITLVIAGPDDGFLSTLKAQIEDLKISDKIIFTGPLYENDKLEAYVDADVYVLPSVYDIFGITVLEACACGTSVIVTDKCGIAEFIDKTGYVVKCDKDELKDAIFKILGDVELRRRFDEGGKKIVRKKFGWDKVVAEVEMIYERIIEKQDKNSRINLNLLYLAPCGLHEGVGGSARLEAIVEVLRHFGANIRLLSYVPKDKFRIEHEYSENLASTKFYVPKSYPKILKVFTIPLIFIYGSKYAKKCDIIISHSPNIVSGFSAMIISKIFGKPFIIDHIDIKDPETPRFIYNLLLKHSTAVFAISHYLENEVNNTYTDKAAYVPIFIDPNIFQIDFVERKKMRENLCIGDKEILIGYAGSYWYVEGIPFLLEAFKGLSNKYDNVRLILIGGKNVPGSDDIPLLIDKLSLKDKVTLVPLQPYAIIPKYLSACDILCSPKIDCEINRAANPVKVVEYLSMGLPAVCSAVGGIIDTIKDDVSGFLVKPGSAKNLEEKLEWIILNPERAKEIGVNGRNTVIENYSNKAIENIILRTIIKVMDEKGI